MKRRLEEKIESLQSENLRLERKQVELKQTFQEIKDKMQANTRAMEILAEVLEEIPEEKVEDSFVPVVSKKEKRLYKKTQTLGIIIMDYARAHPNEVIDSDSIGRHITQTRGRPLGKGSLSTELYKLVRDGLLRRTEAKKRFTYVTPGEVSEKEEVPLTPTGAGVDSITLINTKAASEKVIFEIMRSHANEAMKTKQIREAIMQKYPTLHISRDVIWFHLNKTLGPMGLVKKVSLGSYQYVFPKKELREDDCFAVGGD